MSWIEVENQKDADALMDHFGGFHDTCIREAHIGTGYWVEQDLTMRCPDGLDTTIQLLIQKQALAPSAIELQFSEVLRINWVPVPENVLAIISGATILHSGAAVHWAPEAEWDFDSRDPSDQIWISARRMRWRDASNLMGAGPFYCT